MYLYLMRHGEARPKEEGAARGLTRRGAETVRGVAMDFSVMNPDVGRILHSGKRRAKQTAEIVAELLGLPERVQEVPHLEPDADIALFLPEVGRLQEDTLVVGHLPHLARLAAALLTGSPEPELVRLQPGGVLCLARHEGHWLIEWMIRPVVVEGA